MSAAADWATALDLACHAQANPDLVRNFNAISREFGEPLFPTPTEIAKSLREAPGDEALEVIWRLGGDDAISDLVRARYKELLK